MPDYRSMFDRLYLGVWDLQGREYTVKIRSVAGTELTAPGGRKSKKPVVFFEKTDKGLALNKTNAKTIASMYGNNTDKWIGRLITLYPTQTSFGSEMVEAVRVRPTIPKGRAASSGIVSQPVDPAAREKQDRAAGRAPHDMATPESEPEPTDSNEPEGLAQ